MKPQGLALAGTISHILQFSGGNGCTKRAYSTTQNVITNRLTSEDDETTDFSCDHVRK
ncbi:MAG TPA: hypothetical protein VE378_04855 [Nitrososphaeraceae archaeon]|nr:hypothetical protein [Nitrososphaeraceae archaeon]